MRLCVFWVHFCIVYVHFYVQFVYVFTCVCVNLYAFIYACVLRCKNGKVLSEYALIIKRWTEYCQKIYNYTSKGDTNVLQTINEQHEEEEEEERDDIILIYEFFEYTH